MEITQETIEFESGFDEDIFIILAVTGPNGMSGAKRPKEQYWTAAVSLTAWKLTGDAAIEAGDFRLTAKADDEELESLRRSAGPDRIIRVTVRRQGNRFLIVEPPEEAEDPQLAEVLREQTRVITRRDALFGVFTLDRAACWFETEIEWKGKLVLLTIDCGEEETMEEQLLTARILYRERDVWDERIRAKAAEEFLHVKNKSWLGEGEPELTEAEFASRLELRTISLTEDGDFQFWFGDGGMFWGYSIRVTGSLIKGPERADIVG